MLLITFNRFMFIVKCIVSQVTNKKKLTRFFFK